MVAGLGKKFARKLRGFPAPQKSFSRSGNESFIDSEKKNVNNNIFNKENSEYKTKNRKYYTNATLV